MNDAINSGKEALKKGCKIYCDTNMKSGKTEKEGKYMCAWKNKYKPNVTHWCWTR
jgi:precorrin isomerase